MLGPPYWCLTTPHPHPHPHPPKLSKPSWFPLFPPILSEQEDGRGARHVPTTTVFFNPWSTHFISQNKLVKCSAFCQRHFNLNACQTVFKLFFSCLCHLPREQSLDVEEAEGPYGLGVKDSGSALCLYDMLCYALPCTLHTQSQLPMSSLQKDSEKKKELQHSPEYVSKQNVTESLHLDGL